MQRKSQGFTLMEVLIVVAIIAFLVAVAIPTFINQLSSARDDADLANMRSAYAAASTQYMIDQDREEEVTGNRTYYFDGNALATSLPSGYVGYGQSNKKASVIWKDAPVAIKGTPHPGDVSGYIAVIIGDSGVQSIAWVTGTDFTGHDINTPAEYNSMSTDERYDHDLLLLNSLQNAVRSMTYGELKNLMASHNIKSVNAFGNHTCYENIAYSCIDEESGEIVVRENRILVPELFQAAGFDTEVDANSQYLITSIDLNDWHRNNNKYYIARFFIDAGTNIDSADPNAFASNAIVYLNDNGKGHHDFNHQERVDATNNS